MSRFRLAVSAEMVFLDLPFHERVLGADRRPRVRGRALGLDHQGPRRPDQDGRDLLLDDRVHPLRPGRPRRRRRAAAHRRAVPPGRRSAARLPAPQHPRHRPRRATASLSWPRRWSPRRRGSDAAQTLARLAELGERAGRVFTLENLNTAVDHPGTPFASAADTLALVEAVDNPYLRMNLDLYHAQIGEGNLVQLLDRALPLVGEIQVADVPGGGDRAPGNPLPRGRRRSRPSRLPRRRRPGGLGSGDPLQALDRFRAASPSCRVRRMRRAIVLFELNEVPWEILDDFVAARPGSGLARVLARSHSFTSMAADRGHLSPWTTWPTLHRGVNDERHMIASFGEDRSEADRRFRRCGRCCTTPGSARGSAPPCTATRSLRPGLLRPSTCLTRSPVSERWPTHRSWSSSSGSTWPCRGSRPATSTPTSRGRTPWRWSGTAAGSGSARRPTPPWPRQPLAERRRPAMRTVAGPTSRCSCSTSSPASCGGPDPSSAPSSPTTWPAPCTATGAGLDRRQR